MQDGNGERGEYDDDVALLAEDVDEAMSPVVDELWAPLLGPVREQLRREEEGLRGPSPAEIVERMRANGLHDPEG